MSTVKMRWNKGHFLKYWVLKKEFLLNKDNVAMEEYIETDVKSEADSDIIEFDRMKEVKQKFQYGNAKEEMEEYFEI